MARPATSRATIELIAVYTAIAIVSILHYVAPVHSHHLHDIYRRLYYLPIIVAAFLNGTKGGAIAATVVCVAYAPHAFGHISHDPASDTQKILEMTLYFAVGLTTGSLVSRLKRTQRELESSLDQLHRAENELVRTAQLAAVGRLSAGLAHEIRNPLASIKGSAEILADDFPEGHRKRRLLDVLVDESVRLNNVLTRFLAFARPRPLESEAIAPQAELESVVALLRGQFETGTPRFLVRSPAEPLPSLRGDRDQLRQVFLNVLINAAQAAGPHGSVQVGWERVTSGLCLVVEDSGPGFSGDALTNAFTPFFTTKDQGTGLGLAISHRIVESHLGRIHVTNSKTGGGRVEIELPLAAR